jgi:hypothetical protein
LRIVACDGIFSNQPIHPNLFDANPVYSAAEKQKPMLPPLGIAVTAAMHLHSKQDKAIPATNTLQQENSDDF